MHVRIEGTGPVALAPALWMVRAGIPAQRIALPLNRQATSILPHWRCRKDPGSCWHG